MTVAAVRRNTVSAFCKNGKFDLTSPSKKPNWYVAFQHETNTVLKHCFAVSCVKKFLAAFHTRPVERPKSEGYFDTTRARETNKLLRFEKILCWKI